MTLSKPVNGERRGRIWQIEITTLDVHGEPFLAIAVDRYSRLAVASAAFEAPGDIQAMLEKACADSGCPDEAWIDHGFKFSSAAIEEWGTQHSVAIVWTSLSREHGD
ncbi:transposase family protein [Bradyrhizobium sp. B117]|uniref:integrase catalytic domain-containing protein n=1 Tax=Bradyrhizobium sp. B117 TaxID=3140246 RepID=UPI0031844B0D